ncbi:MAG: hypothetical protein KPI85_00635 [cyanobacterium endosymbiont of Epithemia adnata isolate EadnSB Bon19]
MRVTIAKYYLALYTWYVIAESKSSGFGCLSEMFIDLSHDNVNYYWLGKSCKPISLSNKVKQDVGF